MQLSESIRAHGAMALFAFLVSTSFTVGRAITFALDPAALTFLRFVMAAGIFCIVAILSRAHFKIPSLPQLARYFFLALLLVVFFISMFEALRLTNALNTSAVITLVPFMTALIVLVFFRQYFSLTGYLALIIAGFASLWIMFGGDMAAMAALRLGRGELIFLVGCASYAGYAPAVHKLHKGDGLIYLTLWTLLAGSVLLLIYGWQEIITTSWHQISFTIYLGIAWLALFTTAITFYLIQYAALRLPGVKVNAYTLLIPAFVLLQGLILGNPWPNPSTLAALVILCVAMLVLQRA